MGKYGYVRALVVIFVVSFLICGFSVSFDMNVNAYAGNKQPQSSAADQSILIVKDGNGFAQAIQDMLQKRKSVMILQLMNYNTSVYNTQKAFAQAMRSLQLNCQLNWSTNVLISSNPNTKTKSARMTVKASYSEQPKTYQPTGSTSTTTTSVSTASTSNSKQSTAPLAKSSVTAPVSADSNGNQDIKTIASMSELSTYLHDCLRLGKLDIRLNYSYGGAVKDVGTIMQGEYCYSYFDRWSISYSSTSMELKLDNPLGLDESRLAEMNRLLDDKVGLLSTQLFHDGMSKEDKIKAAHDYIISNTDYDPAVVSAGIGGDNRLDHTPYGCLIKGVAVCEGYAKAFRMLMDKAGIECLLVDGTANGLGSNGPHEWNLVKLDNGTYRHVDTTFDDPIIVGGVGKMLRYDYYLKTDRQIAGDHFWDTAGYPEAK